MTMADSPAEFHVSIVGVDGAATLAVGGEVDMATAPQLRARLDAVIAATSGNVVVDLADVTFLDSAGVVVFVAAQRQLNATGRRLVLRNPSRLVYRVLEISGAAAAWGVGPPALEAAAE